MKKRFLSIEIITYWHGNQTRRPANSPQTIISHTPSPKLSASPNTARFVIQTLAVGLVLGALWGIRKIVRHQPVPLNDIEIEALQKQQERDDRTDRWISELEQNMSEENNDE
jgi:hypothetical protein